MKNTELALGIARIEKLGDDMARSHHHIDIKVHLSEDEHRQYRQATKTLSHFRHYAQLFAVPFLNYKDYKFVLQDALEARTSKEQGRFKPEILYLDINRTILNLLSSIRMYLDYTETSLKRNYGSDSQIVLNFKQACSHAYDMNFSYRFLYRLRNYSQHCGFPITSITWSSIAIDGDLNRPQHSLKIEAERDELLAEFDWQSLKEEIAKQPPMIDITIHLDIMLKCLNDINHAVIKDIFPTLKSSALYINTLLQRIPYIHGETEGEPIFLELEVTEDSAGKATDINQFRSVQRIPVEIVDAAINGKVDDIISRITIGKMEFS